MKLSHCLLVALCLSAVLLVSATEAEKPKNIKLKQQGPVPLHYRRPLIDTSRSSSPEKTEQLSTLAKIIAKEPIAARLKKTSDAEKLDLWNGEDINEESASARKSRVIAKEIKSLQALVTQGKAILKVLPAKEKRLKALKKQLRKLNHKKVAKAAAEKLAAQKQLLSDIAKQEKAMQKRLALLRQTQNKLKTSVKKVAKVAKKGKKAAKKGAKKAKKAGKKAKKAGKKAKKAGKKAKKAGKKTAKKAAAKPAKFMFRSMRSDVEADADSELDSEADADADAELDSEFDF